MLCDSAARRLPGGFSFFSLRWVAGKEAKKNAAQTGGGESRHSINEHFLSQLENWDGKTVGFSFTLGNTSNALVEAGIPKKQIRMDATKIVALLEKHKGMSVTTVGRIPELLENPVVVIDSKKNANSRIVMGDLHDEKGKTVTVVLLLTPTNKKGNKLDIIKISSAEGRGHIKSLFYKENGEPVVIRYVDKERIQSWLNVNRLQLPLHNLGLNPNKSIQHTDPNVNTKFSLKERQFQTIQQSKPGFFSGNHALKCFFSFHFGKIVLY